MFGLIGHPLGHSMSPYIHKKLFEITGTDIDYELCDINPDNFNAEFTSALEKYDGLNVTIPYKTKVIDFLDKLDESAEKYNAVNCIAKKDGKLVGYNTDCIGFLRSIPENILSGKVLLLGCGGAGRMMALETASHKGSLTIAIRESSAQKAAILTNEIHEKSGDASVETVLIDNINGSFDLLANSTPVGMYPYVDNCPVTDEVIKNCENVFDAIYNPDKTVLLQKAEKSGKNAVGGMSMLVLQAAAAHEIWYGAKFTKCQTDELIKKSSEAVTEIFG